MNNLDRRRCFNESIEKYLQVCRAIAAEFARNRALYGDRIQCRAGCSDCCHQLFEITEIEAQYIAEGLSRVEPAVRLELETRARPYMEARRGLLAAGGSTEAWGTLPPPGSRLACPALKDGVCQIYEHRPLICRRFGMPLYNPGKPGRVFACELNFRDGDEIADPALVQIQTAIHEDWKQVQADYNGSGGYRDAEPITVARAILETFFAPADRTVC